jgi:PAS domain S-box-containing protein
MVLTIISFLISDGPNYTADSIGRSCVSLLAIAITAFLAVRMQTAAARLSGQARLLNLTHDAVFVREMTDRVTYWNRGAEELYGWKSGEAAGRSSRSLLRTRFPVTEEKIIADLLRDGRWEGELVHTKRDGTEIIVSSRWSLQTDGRNTPAAILETDTDITASKQAQDRLVRAQAELAHVARVATLGELTTTIAHEVNQPLTGIVTNGEACLRWLEGDELQVDEIKKGLNRIVRDGRRAGDVIHRLRTLSKKSPPQRAFLYLNEVVNDALLLLSREFADHRVIVKVELARSLPLVRADRIQVQQVLINLIVNALQAMSASSEGAELTILTRVLGSQEVLVAIRDSGCGIAMVEEHLFDPFFTTKSDGIGMGLSICRSIIEAHQGRIWPSRNAGAPGSTFQFTLPIEESKHA